MEEVRAYFDQVAPEWDRLRRSYFTEELRNEVLRRAQPQPHMRVADVGCGTGFLATAFAPLVAEVHCVDASAQMLAQAKENLKGHRNVRFHVAEGANLPLETASMDVVMANMYLHHVPDPARALAEMARILRPGGRLVLADMDQHGEEWMHAEMADVWPGFSRTAVREWLERAGLEDVGVEYGGQNCCTDRPAGGCVSIGLFVATGSKPLAAGESVENG